MSTGPRQNRARGTSSKMPAVRHAIGVLRRLAASPDPLPAAALARSLEVPRSTMYHLLSVLVEEGLVVHLPEQHRYGLGLGVFELGSAYLRHDPLEHLARPLLARLVGDVGDTAHLGILHGAELLYLLKVQPEHPTTLVTDVGVRMPAHLAASGRALLAHLPAEQVRALFPSPASFVTRTGSGPRNLPELRSMLTTERRQGWSVEDGLITPEVASVAAASFDHNGHPVASVAVPFRRTARPPESWPQLARHVLRGADALTHRLGGTPPQRPTGPVDDTGR
ncbi:IclR family transcriptional regulator [Halopolyspora algeriensis]|uniref:IclR family transcriptional regulator n=1 Tax=Halopolyspora algeriensis TaxID=1500506 RepID=A0A368VWG5_9ACTN|nr:IclR family transcriptional regulator [Halopolyspora algeriensis]RCW46225.1 IclR family transcriptional regulator [Halopolyspora algeriensis]TQM55628.1 IclR family transcriptional regulator [Halopolyspora algeriensis]